MYTGGCWDDRFDRYIKAGLQVYESNYWMDSNFSSRQFRFKKIVLLQRGDDRNFAPNYYTGIGGHIEHNETPLAGAYRELEEETGLNLIKLEQFALCHIKDLGNLYYYYGLYHQKTLPICPEGRLYWIDKNELLSQKLIPATKEVIKVWSKRQFSLEQPFTINESVVSIHQDGVREVRVDSVGNGL